MGPEPLPGPTLRAKVGDLVELAFFNQINQNNFAATLDKGDADSSAACDQYTTSSSSKSSSTRAAGGDSMPNCLHGSSTTNVHFHGTHTTPATTGDNVLLFIRPALRDKGPPVPSEAQSSALLSQFFSACEQRGPPKRWTDMPIGWQNLQKSILKYYDSTAVYKGKRGGLPAISRLWPTDSAEIAAGLWPQYQIGANPYCFPLPKFDSTKMRMGQAPGTMWYHAHKHGSTALNVANGMTGAFIIEGQYDQDLRSYYGSALRERVLMIQQLSTAPFPLTNPRTTGPGAPRPQISVNGRLNPVVGMRGGEVQLWRIVNGAFRDAIQFAYFQPQKTTPCDSVPKTASVQWRQIAQDGVQFNLWNYQNVGTVNSRFNLAPANRADLLVKAPTQPGKYSLCVIRNSALFVQDSAPAPPDAPSVLLTVSIDTARANPAMDFIPDSRFPTFPTFLRDIQDGEIRTHRDLTFGAGNSTINDTSFADHHVKQAMLLNTAEEWTVKNAANDKSHPFHIHINPFQITELFEPNAPEALDPKNACYVNANDPTTFKPCQKRQPSAPWIWWDTFAIPTAQIIKLNSSVCTTIKACPKALQPYTTCTAATLTKAALCTETIPGWFRMRSRFVDFIGQYVLHCHILIHEDRGMMQLIEVVTNGSPYSHH
jgi:FtsP/CotA-like multicopper oxidase with cupredoxin domain